MDSLFWDFVALATIVVVFIVIPLFRIRKPCKPDCTAVLADKKHGPLLGEIYVLLCDCQPGLGLTKRIFGPPQDVIDEIRGKK